MKPTFGFDQVNWYLGKLAGKLRDGVRDALTGSVTVGLKRVVTGAGFVHRLGGGTPVTIVKVTK